MNVNFVFCQINGSKSDWMEREQKGVQFFFSFIKILQLVNRNQEVIGEKNLDFYIGLYIFRIRIFRWKIQSFGGISAPPGYIKN